MMSQQPRGFFSGPSTLSAVSTFHHGPASSASIHRIESSAVRPLRMPEGFLPNRPYPKPSLAIDSLKTEEQANEWYLWMRENIWSVLRAEQKKSVDWTAVPPSGIEPIDDIDRQVRERADAEFQASLPKRSHAKKAARDDDSELVTAEELGGPRLRRRSAIDAEDAIREEGRNERQPLKQVSGYSPILSFMLTFFNHSKSRLDLV